MMSLRAIGVAPFRSAAAISFALSLCGCGARVIPPPAIPGLVTIPDADRCSAVAVGEGEIWAVRHRPADWFLSEFDLVRIDFDSNRATIEPLNVSGVVFGTDDATLELSSETLWFTMSLAMPDQPRIMKIDSGSGAIIGHVTLGEAMFTRAAVGNHGVWVAASDMNATHELLRIDPETATVASKIPLHSTGLDIAVTENAVWVLHEDQTLSRIDPEANRLLGAIRLNHAYTSLASTPNAVWLVTNSGPSLLLSLIGDIAVEVDGGAQLARLDPRTNEIVATIPIRPDLGTVRVADLFVDGNAIWVSFFVLPREGSDDRAYRLWLAEIDATTSRLHDTNFVGRMRDPSARIAIVDDDIFVCSATLWRIPRHALDEASPPTSSYPLH